jgi:hypothetical protein
MRSRVFLIGLLAFLAGLRPTYGQDAGTVSITVKLAIDPSIGGSVLSAGAATINGMPATITATRWTDTHSESSPLFVADVGYGVAARADVIGGFEYGRAGANLVTLGSVSGGPLSASLDPYQFWGFEGGARVGLSHGHGVYGAVTGGFRRVDAIGATFTSPGLAQTPRNIYDASTVRTFAVAAGLLFGNTPVGYGIEVGVKYAGALKAAAASPELAAVNNVGVRWSLPIGFVVRF